MVVISPGNLHRPIRGEVLADHFDVRRETTEKEAVLVAWAFLEIDIFKEDN